MDTPGLQPETETGKTLPQRIFPLHMTPFERYMHIDDRPDYPMTFIVEFDFTGCLDPDAFRDSIEDALVRQPLLRTIIRAAKLNRDCWVDPGERRPHIHFGNLDEPIDFPGAGIEWIDLRNEPGLRIWIRHNQERAVVTAQFHHAVCDGIGAYQFLGDVLFSYAAKTGSGSAEFVDLSLARFRNRGLASYDPNEFRTEKGRWRSEWSYLPKVTLGRVAAIRPVKKTKPNSGTRSPFPGILSYEFDKQVHRQLRLAAQSRGQMLNDLLLEKLFETFHHWESMDRKLLGRGKVCVMMPLDLREPNQEKMPACNVVTYAIVRRGNKLLNQPEKLKDSLREETTLLKHQRHRSRFMNLVVGSQRLFPRIFKVVFSLNHCLATAVLSNTGDPTKRFLVDLPRENGMVRSGNLLLTSVSGVPPMRVKTRATISIFTYRRSLKICLRCDPNLFDLDDTQVLLDQYVGRIGSVLKSGVDE